MGYMDLALSYSNQMRIVEAPASGGGLSQNSKFSYGYASSAGKRSSMEDFFETRIDGVDGEIVGLFGVFDGHGGARAAEYVKHHLFSNLITHPKFISDTKSAIADAYNHTDSELLKSENNHGRDAGSTASTAILVGDRLLVANVGDSRAVICRGGNAIAVSRDHKPDQSDERERIENAGGFVMWAGTWRVGGVLAVSRAFGDRLLKQYVVADPEIQEEKIDDSLEFLILASDGLWDVFSNEEAVAMVKEVEEPEESSKKLVGEAIRRGSADNITCVVVRFLESKNSNKVPNISSSSSTELNPCKPQDLTSPVETNKAQIKINNDSNIEANKGVVAVRKDSNNKNSAKETSDSGHSSSAKANTVTQKPISAATKDISSGQSSLTGQTKPIPSSSDKKPNQGQIVAADNKLGSSSSNKKLNQKAVAANSGSNQSNSASVATKQVIAAAQSGSLEQSGSVGEKNQKPVAVPSISN